MSQVTVVDQKLAFLRRQKQILTRGIPPSTKLLRIAEEGGLPSKVLGDVMNKVNRDLKRHGREVYSNQMTEHVAEEIDLLYYEAATPTVDAEGDVATATGVDESDGLIVGEDLTLQVNISKLPPIWSTPAEASSGDGHGTGVIDQTTYRNSVSRLQDLSARRLALQQKLNAIQALSSLLEPLHNPQESVQPNLVTQDGPLASEISKTKTLAARVAGRVSDKYGDVQVPATPEGPNEELSYDERNQKVAGILDSW